MLLLYIHEGTTKTRVDKEKVKIRGMKGKD